MRDGLPTASEHGESCGLTVQASYAQQRMWFFEQLQPRSTLYTIQHVEFLSGPFDAFALQSTLDEVIRRHDALHTTFHDVGGRPVQRTRPPKTASLYIVDLTDLAAETRSRDAARIIRDESTRGFDLQRGPLIRFTAIVIEPDRQLLFLAAHHIVFDLWSVGVFNRELALLYGAFRAGRVSPLPDLPLSYVAYVAAQKARFETGGEDPQLSYWRERLRGLPATTEMPTDKPRPPVQTFRGAIRNFTLGPSIADAFRDLTRSADTTLFMSLFAAYAVLIHRHSCQTDLAVGTPIANRGRSGLGEMIGLLLNMVVLRIDLADDPSVVDLLAKVRSAALGAFSNQDVPFELLVDEMKPERDPSRHPLFQTMFVFQPNRGGSDGASQGSSVDMVSNGAKFDLTLTLVDASPSIHGSFEYNVDLFTPDTIERLAAHFETIVGAMAAEPQSPISRLRMMGTAERHEIVETWNATDAAFAAGACVHHLFEEAVARWPDAPALDCEGAVLTYGELDRRATVLAERLQRLGVSPEVRVGLCAERSLDWAAAILAVLKAGGTLVPLDPSFPADRLFFMMEDAGVVLVLTEAGPDAKLLGGPTRLIRLDACDADEGHRQSIPDEVTPKNLAYLVYTSGSTGRPKGVMVEHAGVVNFVSAQAASWGIGPGARVLQFTALGFDIGLSEVFLALCSGACLHLARSADMMPGPPLLRTLREGRITHVTLPPSGLAAMAPEALPDLELIISAGEPCDPALARRWAQGHRLVNAYGPTEATIYATIGVLETDAFPIGRPIANMRVYVLDRHGEPVPAGVAGEIHIGGLGVARGYLNRPDLTAERFIPDTLSGRLDGKLYRTGDLGRFDATGTLHYLGRADRQLKVRGYRIEPGEVESVLRSHPDVADAAVLGLGSGPDARLIAYIIPTETPPLVVALRGFVAGLLPDYMAPAAYVMVKCWPKTPNGKIDHAVLPRPDSFARDTKTSFVGLANRTEQSVAAIWRECLGLEEVGADDNFFDLGGHSLLLVRVYGRLCDELKISLSLVDLFRFPTVRLLAGAIATTTTGHDKAEAAAQARTGQRAALQNAARQQRRPRPGDRYA